MSQVALLPDGRLHLQHGPIDCLVRAWGEPGEVCAGYRQAADAFPAILPTLCRELPHLRQVQPTSTPTHAIARAMHAATLPFQACGITPMAAVAGAVADHVLAVLVAGRKLARAFVNNGGDIAFHLAPGETLRAGLVANLADPGFDGTFLLHADRPARGLATSGRACKGRGGRSFSFGITDSVSVLARSAAEADAAATVIANATDLPGHPAILRRPACEIDPDSDLGDRLVTWDLLAISGNDIATSLDAGAALADALCALGRIEGAVLCLRGEKRVCGTKVLEIA
jgi:ApbE superfamily uncharacterized protein (UPF0280 family)